MPDTHAVNLANAEGPPPLVSVVIPTHQRCQAIVRVLSSLAVQGVSSASYEVVVSIDGSTDGTRDVVASLVTPYPLAVVERPRRGRAAACNAGLDRARGDVVVVLDDDMEVVSEFIERHRSHHPPGSRHCVMGAAPVRIHEHSPLAARYVAAKFGAHLATIAQPGHTFVPRDFYSGNTSLRADVLREVGGFDESFGAYGNEDVDLGLRLSAAGVTLGYDPSALAYQDYTKDLRQLAHDALAKGGTAVSLARAHPDVFDALRLADPFDASRPWLAARAILLALTRRWRQMPDPLFAGARALERAGLWRQPLFYRALLDYAFWGGVDAALANSADEGRLALLADELHRGPIDLLLHR